MTKYDNPRDIQNEICPSCGSKGIISKVKDSIDWTACEIEYKCKDCGQITDYWAYGWFDPCCTPTSWQKIKVRYKNIIYNLKKFYKRYIPV
jgi:hypothetical protein